MRLRRAFWALLLLTLAGPGLAEDGTKAPDAEDVLARARTLFQRYVALEQAFDPALVDLYADDARIVQMTTTTDGRRLDIPVPAGHYKKILLQSLSMARERGDKQIYSEMSFRQEEIGVRVTALRISLQRKTATPVSIVFGPWRGGRWRILEETAVQRR